MKNRKIPFDEVTYCMAIYTMLLSNQHEDEFVMGTEGTRILHMDDGETEMQPGDCVAFPAGVPDGHCLINRTDEVATFLVVGSKAPREVATYSDIDLKVEVENGKPRFFYKDGSDWAGPR